MRFRELNIRGVFQIELNPNNENELGFFMRMYDKEIFTTHGLPTNWVQESIALTKEKGTVRGFHFLYPPNNEAKLISILSGEAFYVFVDIRTDSPTLGKWGSVTLRAEQFGTLFIPRGFAAGMCTLTDNCLVLYRMDNIFNDDAKGGFKWDDPTLAISWPIEVPAVLSSRDQNAQSFKEFLEKSGGGIEVD